MILILVLQRSQLRCREAQGYSKSIPEPDSHLGVAFQLHFPALIPYIYLFVYLSIYLFIYWANFYFEIILDFVKRMIKKNTSLFCHSPNCKNFPYFYHLFYTYIFLILLWSLLFLWVAPVSFYVVLTIFWHFFTFWHL